VFRQFKHNITQRGAAMTELLITSIVLAPLALGAIQFALIYDAKSVLNNATFEAARAGSIHHAQRSPMRSALARNLLPLYGGGDDAASLTGAYARAQLDIQTQNIARNALGGTPDINIISPSRQAFADDNIAVTINNQRQIPNEHLLHKSHARSFRADVAGREPVKDRSDVWLSAHGADRQQDDRMGDADGGHECSECRVLRDGPAASADRRDGHGADAIECISG